MEVSFNSWHPVLYPLAPCDYLSLSELKIKWNLKFSFSVTLAVLVSSHMWLVATILDGTYREHCQYFKAFYWIVPTGSDESTTDESTTMQLHKIWFNLINFTLYSFIWQSTMLCLCMVEILICHNFLVSLDPSYQCWRTGAYWLLNRWGVQCMVALVTQRKEMKHCFINEKYLLGACSW